MKLVHKLTLAMILATSAVLAVNSYLRARREVATYRAEREREHRRVATALGAALTAVWRSDGRAHALAMLEQADVPGDDLSIQFEPGGPAASAGPTPETRVAFDERGVVVRRTTLRLVPSESEPGTLVLSEPLHTERQQVRSILIDRVITTAIMALSMALLSASLGTWLVGRPLERLTDKARRVGQGDFGGPLGFRQRDEIGALGREMDAMCAQLVDAERRTAAETTARIAALEQLRHGDRLMTVGQLASGVAHELGTPLNVISVRADMIAGGETTPEETADYARIISRSCEQMAEIIRQLLDFARPRGPERAALEVRELARRTVALLAPIAAKKGVSLALEGVEDSSIALVDGGQIEQVLANVVVNAIHATPPRGRIAVRVGPERAAPPEGGEAVEVACARVRDSGAGIAPEHLPHVFEPFFTTKDVGQGTGLGLSVAYGIVREHGGWMTVQSSPGEGSEFAIYLPRGGER